MGEVTALENGDTLFTTNDREDWYTSLAAARKAGGDVTLLTSGHHPAKFAARIRYPGDVLVSDGSGEALPPADEKPKTSRSRKATPPPVEDTEDLSGDPEGE